MKIGKITLVLTCCGMAFQTSMAQELPKWANKARKAVFSVITYNKENQILNTGNGFYIDENGTAVSDYTLFKGAERAVVVTADGKELPVEYILGANDMYDVVKFKGSSRQQPIRRLWPCNRHLVRVQSVKRCTYFLTLHRKPLRVHTAPSPKSIPSATTLSIIP